LSSPIFAALAVRRVWTELRATLPDARARFAFCATWAKQVLAAPGIPSRMGLRGRLAAVERFEDDCSRIAVPTLVIAGERELDKVVNLDDAQEYIRTIPGAQFRLFERTGHLGTASAPDRFAHRLDILDAAARLTMPEDIRLMNVDVPGPAGLLEERDQCQRRG
jgi:pimeloyl-ACP methyl ester carboxylesterase